MALQHLFFLLWEYVAYYVGDTDIPDHYRGLARVRF